MRDTRGLHRRNRETRSSRSYTNEQRERDRARTCNVRDDGEDTCKRHAAPERRLMLGREINNDPDAETHGQPWKQPSRRSIGRKPPLQRFARAPDETRIRQPRDAARTRNVPGPNATFALRHDEARN